MRKLARSSTASLTVSAWSRPSPMLTGGPMCRVRVGMTSSRRQRRAAPWPQHVRSPATRTPSSLRRSVPLCCLPAHRFCCFTPSRPSSLLLRSALGQLPGCHLTCRLLEKGLLLCQLVMAAIWAATILALPTLVGPWIVVARAVLVPGMVAVAIVLGYPGLATLPAIDQILTSASMRRALRTWVLTAAVAVIVVFAVFWAVPLAIDGATTLASWDAAASCDETGPSPTCAARKTPALLAALKAPALKTAVLLASLVAAFGASVAVAMQAPAAPPSAVTWTRLCALSSALALPAALLGPAQSRLVKAFTA
eukprot:m.71880 g.71880  ORF g.71880 m.71880 type:complete len:309 (+) comp7654_c0_seq2:1434-2360(+)